MSDTLDPTIEAQKTTGLVSLTAPALKQAKRLLEDEQEARPDVSGLRLGVKGGGCSGFSYKLEFDAEKDRDNVADFEGLKVYIDPKSAIYLKGITLDFHGGLDGKGFVFINPNASSVCGCGESFNV
jgi:iron-sulfur cluster assembly protein